MNAEYFLKRNIHVQQEGESDCGVATVAMVPRILDKPMLPYDLLAAKLGTTDLGGTHHQMLPEVLPQMNIKCQEIKNCSISTIETGVKNGHVFVVNY